MKTDLTINFFPFEFQKDEFEIFYSTEIISNGFKCQKAYITGDWSDNCDVFWSFNDFDNATKIKIHVKDNYGFTKRYLVELLSQHFLKNKDVITARDFINGTIVWIKTNNPTLQNTNSYQAYSIRVLSPKDQFICPKNLWVISLSFDGEKTVSTINIKKSDLISSLITKAVISNQIKRIEDINLSDRQNAFPVYNFKIKKKMNFPFSNKRGENKYLLHYNEIKNFYENYIKDLSINNTIRVFKSGLQPISSSQVFNTTHGSNLMLFGKNQTNFNPYNGLKANGPLALPKNNNIRFFFIFNSADKNYANKLYQYLHKGFKGFPGLYRFVGIPIIIDKDKTIYFEEDNPISAIELQLEKLNFDEGANYLALYISRIARDDSDEEKLSYYYKVKNLLLEKNISSQVIFKENLDNPNFNYFLPNISIAVLAKLGGIPWRLNRPTKNDLIIGIGAFRKPKEKFLGTTICFNNDGTFLGFDSTKADNITDLGNFFYKTIKQFSEKVPEINRIVVHFYKRMNNKEEKELTKAIKALELSIPYIVITISDGKSHNYMLFDEEYGGKMPQSGTCVQLRRGDYLLCNNTRYKGMTAARIDDFPSPLKISVSRMNLRELGDDDIRELIDQVYQFSRMYWVSVKQKSKPVTVLYSEKVAKMNAYFENAIMPNTSVAKGRLWFL